MRFLFTLFLLFISYQLSTAKITHGPFVGHCSSDSISVWARFKDAGVAALQLQGPNSNQRTITVEKRIEVTSDFCSTWTITDLTPNTKYTYQIYFNGQLIVEGDQFFVKTHAASQNTVTKIAFGSCANDNNFPDQPVWKQINKQNPDAMVMLGDTPYIDSTKLTVQRERYKEFYAVPDFLNNFTNIPLYGVWDDHDFGKNDTDGRIPGKEFARQAFTEYHANPTYGNGKEGVYTQFSTGAIDVFLLDTRWFAKTEFSPFDPTRQTLLGKDQWKWLLDGLRSSSAPFKILACGIIWNDATRPNKYDQWITYSYELDALYRFIGEENISGVVLVGGDIHRSRLLKHTTSDLAGYDLYEIIASPLGNEASQNANAPHPNLLYDVGIPDSFVFCTFDTTIPVSTLNVQCLSSSGEIGFQHTIRLDELKHN